MKIVIRPQAFDPWQELQDYQRASKLGASFGATAVFVGSMRDFNEGETVQAMRLEHYQGMTERHLENICQQAQSRWDMLDCLIVHRVGELRPSDPIVLVAVWSVHRAVAFDASRFLMEELKSSAPFWKKEQLAAGGGRWVEKNSPG